MRAVILTGTSGSGKTTVVRELCAHPKEFAHVRAVTTRDRRDDDQGEYDYLSNEDFDRLREKHQLLVTAEYRGNRYGIRDDDVKRATHGNRLPILTITPRSAKELIERSAPGEYLSFFVDCDDQILNERLKARTTPDATIVRQREDDRSVRQFCTVSLVNRDLQTTVAAIQCLAGADGKGGVLTRRIIAAGIKCGVYLERAKEEHLSGASYDLTLGDEYFYAGRIQHLSEENPILLIEPYDYAIVTSNETANLPLNTCGRFDLAVSLFAQGIILSNGPQIDPGFRGPLFCLLFNTSSSPVLVKRHKHYATLELHQLIEPTDSYRGQYQAKTLLDYLPSNAARGAINELKKEVESLKTESRNLQAVTLAVISLILAIVAIWVSLK